MPDVKFPNTRAWYFLIKFFSPAARAKWGKKEEKKGGKDKKEKKPAAEKQVEKKEAEKTTEKPAEKPVEKPKEAEVNEDDLFGGGEDLEAAKKVLEEKHAAEIAAAAAAKKEKKKESAKSYVRFEVKIFDNTTDLDKLAKRIFTEVVMDGLRWEKDYTKEPFAFKVEKLIVSCVIEDDKISSTEDIIEAIVAFDDEELVQSVDILLFNKL